MIYTIQCFISFVPVTKWPVTTYFNDEFCSNNFSGISLLLCILRYSEKLLHAIESNYTLQKYDQALYKYNR